MKKKTTTSIAEMHVDDEGILIVEVIGGVTIDLEKSKAYIEATKKLLGGRKALVLFNASSDYRITEEAKAFAGSKEFSENRIAVAYVTNSVANRLLFNLFLKVHNPIVPSKMFSNEDSALKWLRTFFVMPGDKYVKPKKKL